MSAQQLKAMRQGRKRALKARQRDSVARVAMFRRWLAAGSPSGSIPEIPTDADYAVVIGRASK